MSKQVPNIPTPLPYVLHQKMRPQPDPFVQIAQEQLLKEGYFSGYPRGNFGPLTRDAVIAFQMQHLGPKGRWLDVDGAIGKDTWWALHNPSGDAQRSFISALVPEGIEGFRKEFLEAALKEHAAGTREIPLGSNWGDGVTRFLKDVGPNPWCMFMVSQLIHDVTTRYPFGHKHGHCLTFWNEAKRAGLATLKEDRSPVPGDIGIMRYAPSYSGHAIIILRVSKNGSQFNSIGGNEGDRVKLGLRNRNQPTLLGWVNLWGDLPKKFERGVVAAGTAADSLKGTR